MNGKAGGVGFSGAWADVAGDGTSPLSIDSNSLFYPEIPSTGGSVKVPASSAYSDSQRALATPQSAGTFYFSALVRSIPDYGMYLGVGLGGNLVNLGATNYTLYVTYDEPNQKTVFHITREFTEQTSASYQVAGTGVFLIVGRLTLAAGSDTLAVWVNPPFGSSPPPIPNVSLTGFDIGALTHVFLDGGGVSLPNNNPRVDELKIGTAYNDVVPPGSGNQPPNIASNAAATPSLVTGTSTELSVTASDDAPESELTYLWSYTGGPPDAPVTFSENGTNAARVATATFTAAGTYTFTVTVTDAEGLSAPSSVAATVEQNPTSVVVTPTNVMVGKGDSQQFTATVGDQFNTPFLTSPSLTWSTNGGGNIAADGNFTATTVGGPFIIGATSGSAYGSTSVRVTGETFVHWQATHFTAEEITAGLAVASGDLEGDGLGNFLEYTLGTNPRSPTTLQAPTRDANGHVTFTFTRPKALPGVLYYGEATSALGSWPMIVGIEILTDGDPQTIRLTDPLGPGDSPQRYLRLRVAAP